MDNVGIIHFDFFESKTGMIFEEEVKPKLKKAWQKVPSPIKDVLIFCVIAIVFIQTALSVWSAIHSTIISAYDERWYELANPHMAERQAQIGTLQSQIQFIQSDVVETKTDVREIRVFLMGPKK